MQPGSLSNQCASQNDKARAWRHATCTGPMQVRRSIEPQPVCSANTKRCSVVQCNCLSANAKDGGGGGASGDDAGKRSIRNGTGGIMPSLRMKWTTPNRPANLFRDWRWQLEPRVSLSGRHVWGRSDPSQCRTSRLGSRSGHRSADLRSPWSVGHAVLTIW